MRLFPPPGSLRLGLAAVLIGTAALTALTWLIMLIAWI